MHVPRRTFIKSGTLTAVSAGLVLSNARSAFTLPGRTNNEFSIPSSALRDASSYFTQSTFEPYIGGTFYAPNALGRKIRMKLIDVSGYKTKADTKLTTKAARRSDSFSITFRAGERLPRVTSIHKVSHRELGEFDLFLTPRETKNGLQYEAVFNRAL